MTCACGAPSRRRVCGSDSAAQGRSPPQERGSSRSIRSRIIDRAPGTVDRSIGPARAATRRTTATVRPYHRYGEGFMGSRWPDSDRCRGHAAAVPRFDTEEPFLEGHHLNLRCQVGWQPSRFLADRTEAERAFALAERLGSINAAAAELGTTWRSLRKAWPPPQQPVGACRWPTCCVRCPVYPVAVGRTPDSVSNVCSLACPGGELGRPGAGPADRGAAGAVRGAARR
jgi:hypothetical protein